MGPLVEAGLIEINERGHYRCQEAQGPVKTRTQKPAAAQKPQRKVVGDDYFPAPKNVGIVGDNYFPSTG